VDGDAVTLVERDRSPQDPDRCGSFLVGEHVGIGQPGAVVDRDVDAFPADLEATHTSGVRPSAGGPSLACDAMPGALLDSAELP
jgi:hypothetical protein